MFNNHILLLFKLCVDKFREKKFVDINNLIAKIQIEERIALND